MSANAGSKRKNGGRASAKEGYEITAMNDAWQAIEQLDEAGRRRALEWLVAKAFNYEEYRIQPPSDLGLESLLKSIGSTVRDRM